MTYLVAGLMIVILIVFTVTWRVVDTLAKKAGV